MTPYKMSLDERIEQLDLSLFGNARSANPEKDLVQSTDGMTANQRYCQACYLPPHRAMRAICRLFPKRQ
jgi:hypothetical protein